MPTFLLRDGLLTLMYKASFIALLRFWSSLPTMLKFSTLMLWSVVIKWSNMGEGAFWCFFEPLTKGSWGLSYIFLITLQPSIFVTIDDPTLLLHRIFILGGPSGGFWWWYLLWNILVHLSCCIFSWHFHSVPYNMEQLYRVWGCCFTEWFCSSFSGLPKIHKEGTPLRPIVQHWGSNLFNIKRVIEDPQAPGGKIGTPHLQ